mmetsp:Transcript_26583/g.77333  ORF Transcript_26583/g.77333 Transcript_26583/m.77333 type:complete len:237 (-) Transcript_26583:2673-3383(-)
MLPVRSRQAVPSGFDARAGRAVLAWYVCQRDGRRRRPRLPRLPSRLVVRGRRRRACRVLSRNRSQACSGPVHRLRRWDVPAGLRSHGLPRVRAGYVLSKGKQRSAARDLPRRLLHRQRVHHSGEPRRLRRLHAWQLLRRRRRAANRLRSRQHRPLGQYVCVRAVPDRTLRSLHHRLRGVRGGHLRGERGPVAVYPLPLSYRLQEQRRHLLHLQGGLLPAERERPSGGHLPRPDQAL